MFLLSLYNSKYVDVEVSIDIEKCPSIEKNCFLITSSAIDLVNFVIANHDKEDKSFLNIVHDANSELPSEKQYSHAINVKNKRSFKKALFDILKNLIDIQSNANNDKIKVSINISNKTIEKELELDYVKFEYINDRRKGIFVNSTEYTEKDNMVTLHKELKKGFTFKQSFKIDQEKLAQLEEDIENSTSVGLNIASLDDIRIEFIKPDDTQKLML